MGLLLLSIPGIVLGLLTIAFRAWLPQWTAGFSVFVLEFLESAVLGSAAIYYFDQADRGNDVSGTGAVAKAWYHVPDLLAAAVISFAIIAVLFITVLGIPFAVIRIVRWYFTSQAIMIDGQEGEPSLGYSADLVAGRGWPTAGSLLALSLIQYLPVFAFLQLLGMAVDKEPMAFLRLAIAALLFPFGIVARTLLYYDLKMRKALA
jgi:hypothetical protein